VINIARTNSARHGFTAIELMMVLGIMMIMMGMAAPVILPALRHGKINSAINDIMACWREARIMAMSHSIPSTNAVPPHFGIAINQGATGQASVSLIYDSVASGIPNLLVQGQDPSDASTYSATKPAVAQYFFNRNVVLATSPTTTGTPTASPITIILYAQYGTGLALDPADVAAGRGSVAAPTSLGIAGLQATSMGIAAPPSVVPSVCPITMLQSVDFVLTPRRGFSTAFAIYNAGFIAAQEQ
jgi:Tfp pilus assembly protein FimT